MDDQKGLFIGREEKQKYRDKGVEIDEIIHCVSTSREKIVKKERKVEKKRNDNTRKKKKQVPRGYIRCDYFVATRCIIDYDVIL